MSGVFSLGKIKKMVDLKERSGNIFIDEYILVPDHLSGIREILFLDVFPAVETAEMVHAKLNVTGVLRYSIAYVTEEHFSQIKAFKGELNFSYTLDHEADIGSDMHFETWVTLERCDHAIVNAKKISLNAVIKVWNRLRTIEESAYISDFLNKEQGEYLKREGDFLLLDSIKEEEFKVQGKLELPYDKPEIEEILMVNVYQSDNVLNDKSAALDVSSTVKGKVVYLSTKGRICCEDFEFSDDHVQSLRLENDLQEHRVLLRSRLLDVMAQAMEDRDGERRLIRFEARFLAVLEVYEPTQLSYIQDFYFLGQETKSKEGKAQLLKEVKSLDKNFNLRMVYEGLGDFEELVINGSQVVFDYVVEADKCVIVSGVVKASAILLREQGQELAGLKFFEFPFSETLPLDADIVGEQSFQIEVSPGEHIFSFLGEGRIELEIACALHVNILISNAVSFLEDIQEGEGLEEKETDHTLVRLYFTNPVDNLWTICKKHRLKRHALLALNPELDFEKLEEGTMTILP